MKSSSNICWTGNYGENARTHITRLLTCPSDIVDWQEMMHYIDDACSGCAPACHPFALKPPYHIHNYPNLISAATGMDIDEAGLKKCIRGTELARAINIRRGMRRADEKPPEDHWKKRFPELEEKLLDAYYKFKGWNNDGIPTKETLEELDMGYVGEDLEQRGILKMAKIKKKIKTIKIDADKCNGCRACEMICSAFHANPKYSSNNPARSRIRMIRDPMRDVYLPVYAGEYTAGRMHGQRQVCD